MPTDFVAKWLSFLGRMALYWARLKEPRDERDRDFLLLSLGWTSLAVFVLLLVSVIPLFAGALDGIFTVESNVEWFLKAGRIAERVVLASLLAPNLVGIFFGLITRRYKRVSQLAIAAIASAVIMAIGVGFFAMTRDKLGLQGIWVASSLPVIIALCPPYPRRADHSSTAPPAGRRFRIRPRIPKDKASA